MTAVDVERTSPSFPKPSPEWRIQGPGQHWQAGLARIEAGICPACGERLVRKATNGATLPDYAPWLVFRDPEGRPLEVDPHAICAECGRRFGLFGPITREPKNPNGDVAVCVLPHGTMPCRNRLFPDGLPAKEEDDDA